MQSTPNKSSFGYGKAVMYILQGEAAQDHLRDLLQAAEQQKAFSSVDIASLLETAQSKQVGETLITILQEALQTTSNREAQIQQNADQVSFIRRPGR